MLLSQWLALNLAAVLITLSSTSAICDVIMFPNITFSTVTFGPTGHPRTRQRIALLNEEIAGDTMVIDSNDDLASWMTELETEDVSPNDETMPFIPLLKQNQQHFLTDLPDETILHIVTCLLQGPNIPFNAVQSLSLTCRRFYRLTSDPTSLHKSMEYHHEWETNFLYPQVTWTIANVKRFLKSESDAWTLCNIMYDECFGADPRAFRAQSADNCFWTAIAVIRALDGLRDNYPNHRMIEELPFPLLVALHFSAILFGKLFMIRREDKLSWSRIYDAGFHERQAVMHTFLRGGPIDAMNLWLWDALPASQFESVVRKFKSTIVYCSKQCPPDELGVARPDLWIRQQIVENKDEWLRQSDDGKIEAAWDRTGLDAKDRAHILSCLKSWWRVVPTWLD